MSRRREPPRAFDAARPTCLPLVLRQSIPVSQLHHAPRRYQMKQTAWTAAAIFCATALGVAAQTPATTTSATTMDKSRDQITVTGCLQESSRNSTATTSSTSTTAGDYTLANATIGKSASSSTTASSTTTAETTTAATTGTTGSTATDTTRPGQASYTLDGSASELKSHVGHRIEVSGTLENNHDPSASSTATSTTTSAAASSRMESGPQRIKVSSVRMIAADCASR